MCDRTAKLSTDLLLLSVEIPNMWFSGQTFQAIAYRTMFQLARGHSTYNYLVRIDKEKIFRLLSFPSSNHTFTKSSHISNGFCCRLVTVRLEKTRMGERKAVIKNADMPNDMQDEAVQVAAYAVDHFDMEKDIAAHLKKEFDRKYSPTWHCIVGKNFGSYVTHETQNFIYFYFQDRAFLLFKSG
ncbi:putative dynein light chain [Clonorchis sinensis]|uniref:Dynein light chain n=1 Tax=Clonorchis sinensis TaxID=79923 RepID=A0A8T1MYM0_CLOSI|nr:putative dynein light chain [Clonorchis sinensis]